VSKKRTRTKTERVDKVIEEILLGNEDPMLRRSLNRHELALYDEMVAELRQGLEPSLDAVIWRLDFQRQPVQIGQFLDDPYYLGEVHLPLEGENEGIWPAWKTALVKDFDLHSKIHNLVITGSLGIGKTTMMVTLILYRLYIATCLKSPQNFFGLSRGARIFYVILSVTKEAVKDTAFGDAMNFMAQSPYFREECKYDPDQQYSGFRIPLRNSLPNGMVSNLFITAGSKSQHAIGRNIVCVGMDEGNFRLEENPDLTAYELYDQVRTRISNRFQKVAGFLPALSVIASSASDESSFTEKVIGEIVNANNPKTQLVYRHAIYHIKRHAITLLGWWFKVAYGLKNMEPFILEGLYNEDGSQIPAGEIRQKDTGEPITCTRHEEPPNGASTELVPGDHLEAFRRNCRAQLQNLSGISTGGSHRLFPSTVDIEWCIEQSVREGVPDPLTRGMAILPISSEDNKYIWDYLDHKSFLTMVQSRILPIRHPQNLRYAHLDLATQSMCGLAVCHLVGNQLVTGLVKDGEPFSEYRLVVEYDFIITITAGREKPINLEKVQRFFFWLRDMCGYRFGLITADMFQSEMPLQGLEARGFEVDKLSVDRDKTVYNAWKMGFEERRIRLMRSNQMIREAESLLEMDKKYDHPPDGSKDTSDASAGAFFNAVNSEEKLTLMSHNAATVLGGQQMGESDLNTPPIEIVLPKKGYERTKTFVG
jgi:hypothetical protein